MRWRSPGCIALDPMQLAVKVHQAEFVGRKRLLDPAVTEHDLVGRVGLQEIKARTTTLDDRKRRLPS